MSKDRMIADDYNMLIYFHKEKGDLNRWSSLEERMPVIREFHPELVDAIEQVEIAKKTLDVVLERVCEEGSAEVFEKYNEW